MITPQRITLKVARMSNDPRQTETAGSVSDSKENRKCEVIDSQSVVHAGSGVVSPAISLAISPSTDENYKTESDGDQSSNQPGGTKKPNCYECKHRRSLPGDAHSECVNPRISDVDRLITPVALMSGLVSASMKRLNVRGDRHGIESGWFMWPLNYDPVWLITCDGFEEK